MSDLILLFFAIVFLLIIVPCIFLLLLVWESYLRSKGAIKHVHYNWDKSKWE